MMKVSLINLNKMLVGTEPFLFTAPTKELFAKSPNDDASFWQDGQITVEGVVCAKGHALEVKGNVQAVLNLACSLCLEETQLKMDIPFCQEYQDAASQSDFQGEPDEFDLTYYSGDELNFGPLVKDTLLLAQPLRVLCRQDCRGLCPDCGANLNTAHCGCQDDKIDVRMSVLETFLKSEKDS